MVFGHNHRKAKRLARQAEEALALSPQMRSEDSSQVTLLSLGLKDATIHQTQRRELYEHKIAQLEKSIEKEALENADLEAMLEQLRIENHKRAVLYRQHGDEVYALDKSIVAANMVWSKKVVASGVALASQCDSPLQPQRKTLGGVRPLGDSELNSRWKVQNPAGLFK